MKIIVRQIVAWGVASAAVAMAGPSWAGPTFKLAGVNVTIPGDGWEVFPAKAPSGMLGSGGIDGTLPSEARLAVLKNANGRVMAALLISSHYGAKRPVTIGGRCPQPRDGDSSSHYVSIGHPMGGPRTCSMIAGPGDGDHLVGMIDSLGAARTEHPFDAPDRAYFVWGYSVDQMASHFSVEGVIAEGFVGLEGKVPSGTLANSFEPALAAWNDAFAAALKEALGGVFSRSTQLPAIVVKTAQDR